MERPKLAYHLVSGAHSYPLLFGTWIVGRGRGATILVADDSVSREHAIVRVSPGSITVEDVGSRNGTQVNGVPVRGTVAMHAGDVLRVGKVTFELLAEGPDESGIWTKRTVTPTRAGGEAPASEQSGPMPVGQGARRAATPTAPPVLLDDSPGTEHTAVLGIRDGAWRDAIRRAAVGHEGLRVVTATPAALRSVLASLTGRAALLIDVGPPEDEGARALNDWTTPARRGPVLVTHRLPETEGATLARRLGADGYVRLGRPSSLVVAQLVYFLRRREAADPADGHSAP